MVTPLRFLAHATRGSVLAGNKPVPAQATFVKKPHTNMFQKVRQPGPSSGKFAPFAQKNPSQQFVSQPRQKTPSHQFVKKSSPPSSSKISPQQRTHLQHPKPFQGKLTIKKAVLKDVVKAHPPKLKVKLQPVKLAEVSFKNAPRSSKQLFNKPALVIPKIQVTKKPKQLTPTSLVKQRHLKAMKAQVKSKKLRAPQPLRHTSIKTPSLGKVKGKQTIKSLGKGNKKLGVTLKTIVPAFARRKSIKGKK
eukprot:GEMP01026731.1.p1 GENE.GEMP01026731.1~~GEMP01026731.1.p1  ORF type:complete len:248 (+),score=69.60 GEMP01026731.1:113-856(+)